MDDIDAVVLAAGKGTRMSSSIPKVLHRLEGKPILEHLLVTLQSLRCGPPIVVVGYGAQTVKTSVPESLEVRYVLQNRQLGTGHALLQTKGEAESKNLLVIPGDVPLVTHSTLKAFVENSLERRSDLAVLTTRLDDPTGYGRIIRDKKGDLTAVVEERDATTAQKEIQEINTGIFLLKNTEHLWQELSHLDTDNDQGELYLTDLVERFRLKNRSVTAILKGEVEEFLGINTRRDLVRAHRLLHDRRIDAFLNSGVTITNPHTTLIGNQVQIGKDTVVRGFSVLEGETWVGKRCRLGPAVHISDSKISRGVSVTRSRIIGTTVKPNTTVGPYSIIGA
ncbi:MAG: NTP transferase domain-containing protein [Candidatus Acetothermia bacterium]